MQLPIFGYEKVGEWISDSRTEETQDKSAKKEGCGVGHDLFIDRAETHIVPVEGWAVRSAEQEGADPVGSTEDRNHGPGIVEKGASHKREKVESQCPGADDHHDCVKSVGRGKSDEGSNGKGQRRSLRRLLEMEDLFQQGSK